MRTSHLLPTLLLPLALLGCPQQGNDEPLTLAEARQAVEESTTAGQAERLTGNAVEISTNFTIGEAVQNAAEELRSFIQSQLPCAEITRQDATLTIDYGVKSGNCTYNGHTFSGSSMVTVARNDDGSVVVDHTWNKLSNGVVEVSGTAQVTWSRADKTRHVVHELTWERLEDGATWVGDGDRTQRSLNGGILEGIQVDGDRSWTGSRGRYDLAIDSVQMRWVDPVPQAGSYVLATPNEKTLTKTFERVDEDTIRVTVSGMKRSFSFLVSRAGQISAGESL